MLIFLMGSDSGFWQIRNEVRDLEATRLDHYLLESSACFLAHLYEVKESSACAAFFFCRHDDQESLQARTIIGSLAKQFAQHLSIDAFRDLQPENIDLQTITDFLSNKLDRSRQYYVLLDGLDECQKAQIEEVLEALKGMTAAGNIQTKIFWSSRPSNLEMLPVGLLPDQRIDLEDRDHREKIAVDICKYIEASLEDSLDGESPKLQISDPTLALTIMEHLEQEAHGMFVQLY